MKDLKFPCFLFFVFHVPRFSFINLVSPYRTFLFAFTSSMDLIPHFSLFPVGGLQCSVLFSGTGIPCLPFDPFMPLVFISGRKYAFSSERKNQFPLSRRMAQGFY